MSQAWSPQDEQQLNELLRRKDAVRRDILRRTLISELEKHLADLKRGKNIEIEMQTEYLPMVQFTDAPDKRVTIQMIIRGNEGEVQS